MSKRLLGIDYGRARIGLAVSDALGISTKPLGFISRVSDAQAAALVAHLAEQEQVGGLVIGLPLHAQSGEAGENVQWVRAFVVELGKYCTLPVHEVDERYSSTEAEEALKQAGAWPALPGQLDAKAAAIILRRYLDGE